MRLIAERLHPRQEIHLCGFQLAFSSCFTAYPLDDTTSTASSDSDNAARVDKDDCQVVCRHFWVTCTYTSLKQNTDQQCYCSNQSLKIAIQGYIVNEGQVSDFRRHTSRHASTSSYGRFIF